MESIGIVRRIDDLGRVVLPKELRRTLGIGVGHSVHFHLEGQQIVLGPLPAACLFCGGDEGVVAFEGKNVCRGCIAAMPSQAV